MEGVPVVQNFRIQEKKIREVQSGAELPELKS
jgi:hypothetical protein